MVRSTPSLRSGRPQAPTAPTRRQLQQPAWVRRQPASTARDTAVHPLTERDDNARLQAYELEVKGRFERIIPVLQRLSALQHDPDFTAQAQRLARAELGFDLPEHILAKAWVRPLDMRALFAWCVFQSHQTISDRFFLDDPLNGGASSAPAEAFNRFLLDLAFIFSMSRPAPMVAWRMPSLTPCGSRSVRCGVGPMPEPCSMWRTPSTAG